MMIPRRRKGPKPVETPRIKREPPTPEGFAEIAKRPMYEGQPVERKLLELKMLWRNAKEMGLLTPELRDILTECAASAKSQGGQHG